MKIALLGCGTVGSAVLRHLTQHAADLEARVGVPVQLAGVAVRRSGIPRPGVPEHLLTTDADALVRRDDVDIVVEVIGGAEPARELITTAFAHGASVVSANKTLIAAEGPVLHAAAAAHGVDLLYEAAVAGAIPLVRTLRESLAGDRVHRVVGVLNGAANLILDKMHSTGADHRQALKEAVTALGHTAADPSADIEGLDAASEAAILASIAFGTWVRPEEVHREGITEITATHIGVAKAAGCVIKQVAVCDCGPEGSSVNVRVHPALVPSHHPIASVHGTDNAVVVDAHAAGRLIFYGPGRGGAPTAGAVLGDLVEACRNRLAGVTVLGDTAYRRLTVSAAADAVSQYHVSLDAAARPTVLDEVVTVLGRHGVAVAALSQSHRDGGFSLDLFTHQVTSASMSAATGALGAVHDVRRIRSVIRVESAGSLQQVARDLARSPARRSAKWPSVSRVIQPRSRN